MPHRSSRRTGAFSPSLFGDGWAVFLRFAPHSRPLGAHSGHSPNGGSAFSVDCRDTAFPTVRQSGDYARVKGRCRHKKADFIVLSAKTARKTPFVPVLRQPFVRPCAGNGRLPSAKRRFPRIGSPSAATGRGANFPSRRTVPPPTSPCERPFPLPRCAPALAEPFAYRISPYFHVQTSFPRPATQCGRGGSRHFTRRRTSTRRHTASAHHRSRHRAPHFGCRGAPQRTHLAL